MKLFGTDGVRGQVGSVSFAFGYSMAQILPGRAALIGQDSRDMIVAALSAGLTDRWVEILSRTVTQHL